MHVRVRLAGAGGAAGERVVALESRLTSVERFRRLVRDKFSVPPARQRLFYGGKLLENGYTFHDYNIKLNDVIQLMVQVLPQDENDVEKSDVKKSEAIVYEDTKSNLYEIGDLIDMRDQEQGAWFEGSIIGIVKDPHYKPFKIDTSKQNGSKSTENGETCDSDTTSLQKSSLQAKQNGDSTNLKSPTSKINCAKSPTAKKNGTASPTNKKNGLNSPNASSSSPGTPSRKRGITDYFSKTPKSSNVKTEEKENGLKAEQNGLNGEQNRLNGEQNGLNSEENVPNSEENGNDSNNEDVNMDTDVGILYKVNLIYDDVNDSTSHYCKLQDIRPRARSQVAVEDLKIGQKVMINHNTEEPNEKGYWYDFTVKEIRKHRKSYELVGTLYLGPEAVPQHDTSVKLRDKIYAVQEVVPLAERTEEERRAMVTALEQRPLPLHCTTCRDNEDAPCRECGCYLCSGKNDPEKIILCDECNHGFHMACLDPPMTELPEEDWYCSSCKRDPNDVVAPGAARQTKKANHSKDKRDWGRGMACVGKTQTCAMPANHFGPIPGVEVGMAWRFRIQLSESGVHRPPVSGIHGRDVHGAYSLVLSGGYEDDVDNGTEFTYTGSGGRDLSGNKRTADQSSDQTLTRENKSLARNCAVKDVSEKGGDAGDKWREGRPVRVVRSYKMKKHFPQYAPDEGIRYDGIYKVVKYYPETGKSGFRVWKYLLRRDDPSPAPWDKDAKKYSIIYPAGYLEAEAEKKALKEHKLSKTSKKRVLKESNYNEEDADESITESPPMKKRKTRTSKAESSDEDTPLSKRKRQSSKNQTSPKSINPFTLAKVKMPNSSEKSKLGTKSANKSPIRSPTKKLENILTEEELEVIKADKLNSKLWEDCLSVCKTGGKKQLIEHVTQVFLCIICQDVAANPVTTKCQHNFCMSCLKLAFKSTGSESCSHCRQDLSKDELEHNGQLKTALRTLMPGYDIGKK